MDYTYYEEPKSPWWVPILAILICISIGYGIWKIKMYFYKQEIKELYQEIKNEQ